MARLQTEIISFLMKALANSVGAAGYFTVPNQLEDILGLPFL